MPCMHDLRARTSQYQSLQDACRRSVIGYRRRWRWGPPAVPGPVHVTAEVAVVVNYCTSARCAFVMRYMLVVR